MSRPAFRSASVKHCVRLSYRSAPTVLTVSTNPEAVLVFPIDAPAFRRLRVVSFRAHSFKSSRVVAPGTGMRVSTTSTKLKATSTRFTT